MEKEWETGFVIASNESLIHYQVFVKKLKKSVKIKSKAKTQNHISLYENVQDKNKSQLQNKFWIVLNNLMDWSILTHRIKVRIHCNWKPKTKLLLIEYNHRINWFQHYFCINWNFPEVTRKIYKTNLRKQNINTKHWRYDHNHIHILLYSHYYICHHEALNNFFLLHTKIHIFNPFIRKYLLKIWI